MPSKRRQVSFNRSMSSRALSEWPSRICVDDGTLHDHERPLYEVERPARLHVEEWEFMTCAAAEPGSVGKRERRIVAQFRGLVGARRSRRLPAQIVLPTAERDSA